MDEPTPKQIPPAPPPPPPPPPPSLAAQSRKSVSPQVQKPDSASKGGVDGVLATSSEAAAHGPIYYFFYGTLRDSATLARILDRTEPPQLRPAQIAGFELASWGQYRTLIEGLSEQVVEGLASLIVSPEEAHKLAYYETNAYTLAPCQIIFTDTDGAEPANVLGRTFVYAGDAQALKHGRFDRRLWETQMKAALPVKWGHSGIDGKPG